MSASISIRRATEEDAEVISALSGELGYAAGPEVMRIRIRAILASPADLLIVAVHPSNAIVGWLQAHAAWIVEAGYRVEIVGLIVTSPYRRLGAGRAMIAEVERWAEAISAEAVVVRTNIQRIESHAFYPALGFKSTKTQVVYRKPRNS